MDKSVHNLQDEYGILKENEDVLYNLIKIAPYVNTITSLKDGKFIEVNDLFTHVIGYTRDEARAGTSLSLNIYVNPEDRNEIIYSLRSGKPVRNKECRYRKKNGDIIIGLYSGALITIGGESCLLSSIQDITELKHTEEKLKNQTDAMEASIDGMAILNSNQTYVYLNTAHSSIYGYENPNELIGASWRILYSKEELSRFEREIMPELMKNGHFQGRAIGKKKDGSTFPQSLSLSTLKDGGLICVVRDITNIVDVEEKIRKSEQKFMSIANYSASWEGWFSPEGKLLWMNEYSMQLTGYSPEEYISSPDFLAMAIVPEDLERVSKRFGEAIANNNTDRLETRIRRKDGSIFWGLVSWRPILNSEGRSIGFRTSTQDITAIKNLEMKATQEQSLNKVVISSIPGTFYMLDKFGKYVKWNDYQRDIIVGKSDEEMVNVSAIDTIYPEDRELIQSKIVNVLQNGATETVEGRVLLRGGPEYKWLLMTGSKIVIEGNPFLVGTGIDITERKQIDETKENNRKELEKMNELMVGRELRMVEMKKEIEKLTEQIAKSIGTHE